MWLPEFPVLLVELWAQLRGPCSLPQGSCQACGRSQNWDPVTYVPCCCLPGSTPSVWDSTHATVVLDGIIDSMGMSLSKIREMVQGSLAGCSPWGRKESDTTERLNSNSIPFRLITQMLELSWGLAGHRGEDWTVCIRGPSPVQEESTHIHSPCAGDSLTGALTSSPSGPLPSQKVPPHCESTLFLPQSGIFILEPWKVCLWYYLIFCFEFLLSHFFFFLRKPSYCYVSFDFDF